eukprot:2296476-Rhodomonas_salina.1
MCQIPLPQGKRPFRLSCSGRLKDRQVITALTTIMAGLGYTKAFCSGQQLSLNSNMFGGRLAMAFCRAGGVWNLY